MTTTSSLSMATPAEEGRLSTKATNPSIAIMERLQGRPTTNLPAPGSLNQPQPSLAQSSPTPSSSAQEHNSISGSETQDADNENEAGENGLISGATDTLDLLFLLSSILCPIVIAFLLLVLPTLSPDLATTTNNILLEVVALLRAQLDGSLGDLIPSADVSSPVSPTNLWATTFWCLSLMLNLTTILLIALVKQWIRYKSLRGRPAFFHYSNRQTTFVNAIIATILPAGVFSYLSLFILGLVVYLWDLSRSLAIILLIMATVVLITFLEISRLSLGALAHRVRSSSRGRGRDFIQKLVPYFRKFRSRFQRANVPEQPHPMRPRRHPITSRSLNSTDLWVSNEPQRLPAETSGQDHSRL